MKKIILLALFSISMISFAQNSVDISLSFGIGTHSAISDKSLSQFDYCDKVTFKAWPGAASLQFMYNLNDNFAIGIISCFDMSQYKLENKTVGNSDKLSLQNMHFSLLPAVRYYYWNKINSSLYSKIAAGYSTRLKQEKYSHSLDGELEKESSFGFQFSALGYEYGNSKVRAFIEIGYGCQGFLQTGVKIVI